MIVTRRCVDQRHAVDLRHDNMISSLVTLILILAVILLISIVLKVVKWGITLAVIVGIIALIAHFMKKT